MTLPCSLTTESRYLRLYEKKIGVKSHPLPLKTTPARTNRFGKGRHFLLGLRTLPFDNGDGSWLGEELNQIQGRVWCF